MKRSLDEMRKSTCRTGNYTLEELAEAAARHNTPFAPYDWITNEEWKSSFKGKDFQDDYEYALLLLTQDKEKVRNLTFMH